MGEIVFGGNRLEFGIKKNRRCEGGKPGGRKQEKYSPQSSQRPQRKTKKIVGWLRQKTANDKK